MELEDTLEYLGEWLVVATRNMAVGGRRDELTIWSLSAVQLTILAVAAEFDLRCELAYTQRHEWGWTYLLVVVRAGAKLFAMQEKRQMKVC